MDFSHTGHRNRLSNLIEKEKEKSNLSATYVCFRTIILQLKRKTKRKRKDIAFVCITIFLIIEICECFSIRINVFHVILLRFGIHKESVKF